MGPDLNENRATIRDALASLMQRTNSDAFVIIEDAKTSKFVQFASSVGEPLLFDLPVQALSEIEFSRAVQFFRAYGVTVDEHDLLDSRSGKPVKRQVSFNVRFSSP